MAGYYLGECNTQDNTFEGKGACLYPNGDLYEGTFFTDIPHGQGRKIYVDGSFYNGQWLAGERHGNGEFESVDGVVYTGQWKNDK